MAKRFTETGKWGDAWFRKLPPAYKAFWLYLVDSCDAAGVWDADMELASFQVGEKLRSERAFELFEDRVVMLENGRWWIWKFIPFQHGQLSEGCKPHQYVVKILKQHGIYETFIHTLTKGYPKGMLTFKDKDKDKGIKEGECEGNQSAPCDALVGNGGEALPKRNIHIEAEQIYEAYPRKIAKPEALKAIKKQLAAHTAEFLLSCTRRYCVSRAGQDPNFTPHPATWFNREQFNDDPATWGSRSGPPTTRENETKRTGIETTAGKTIREL